jgi:tripartite-type tricarboxylate transporter receptor subunit TctC
MKAAINARRSILWLSVVAAVSTSAFQTDGANAQAADELYKDKTINLIIASGEGGGFDIAGRLAAQFLGRFLPGNPRIVPQNMPGANGIRATEYLFRVAPRDGLTIGVVQPLMVLNKIMDPSARYSPEEFKWIGRMTPFPTFGVAWHTAPVQSFAQATQIKLTLAAGGPLGPASILPQALNRLAGTQFVVVKGYPSANEQGLAMERGEVEGMGSASEEYVESKGWFASSQVKVVYTIGRSRRNKAPDAPTVVEVMTSERDRNVMKLITSATDIGRAFVAPPEIPAARAKALQTAFDMMLKNPDFIAEARKRSIEVEALAPERLQNLVAEAMSMPEDVMDLTRAVTRGEK